jgi:glycosyltransferase involved in cell wall biosynthesis
MLGRNQRNNRGVRSAAGVCPKLVHVTTIPLTLYAFFDGQLRFMKEQGFDVQAITSPGSLVQTIAERDNVPIVEIEMPRSITPIRDLIAVARLWRTMRRIKPQIVHSHTPKGGMLGMIAAWAAGVPVRIYTIHGFPFATATGRKRTLLRFTERLSSRFADEVLCVSHSLRDFAISEEICPESKIKVLRGGSTNGVDALQRFNPSGQSDESRRKTRQTLGIPADAVVVGFLGRIVRDKGLIELTTAWQSLKSEFPELHLLIVGPFEPRDPVPAEIEQLLQTDDRIHLTGLIDDPVPMYAVMDLLVLPSYREGFPYAPLEAAAMELPVVATRVTGCIDAIEDGVTGQLVPVTDADALRHAIRAYVVDAPLRRKHGTAGRSRVLRDFRQEVIWNDLLAEYSQLLRFKGIDAPSAVAFSSDG